MCQDCLHSRPEKNTAELLAAASHGDGLPVAPAGHDVRNARPRYWKIGTPLVLTRSANRSERRIAEPIAAASHVDLDVKCEPGHDVRCARSRYLIIETPLSLPQSTTPEAAGYKHRHSAEGNIAIEVKALTEHRQPASSPDMPRASNRGTNGYKRREISPMKKGPRGRWDPNAATRSLSARPGSLTANDTYADRSPSRQRRYRDLQQNPCHSPRTRRSCFSHARWERYNALSAHSSGKVIEDLDRERVWRKDVRSPVYDLRMMAAPPGHEN